MRATRRHLQLATHEVGEAKTVDVGFDGHRVWSFAVPEPQRGVHRQEWPAALLPYLNGRTRLEVIDSATGEAVAVAEEVRFGAAEDRIQVVDATGRWLAVNKWDRLGPVFEGNDSGVQERLLTSAHELAALLEGHGFPLYLVGGSLLGLLRSGGMLPHDDDIDFAYLSEKSHPSDIGLESYRMQRILAEAGHTVIRHSLTHLELDFFDAEGHVDYYIDIFTGFFRDGLYCQPFALRGPEVSRADLVPVGRAEIAGVELPVPAEPEAWLEYAYGADWRIPDPTFTFDTPASTRRRFNNWFGVYNRARVYWEKHYLKRSTPIAVQWRRESLERFLEAVPAGANIVELGSGDGWAAARLAQAGHRVVAVDFSHEAMRIARGEDAAVEYRYVNLNDRHDSLALAWDLVETREPWWVYADGLIQGLTIADRSSVYLFLRMVLRGEAFAWMSMDTDFTPSYVRENPETWHYPIEWLEDEIAGTGLAFSAEYAGERATPHGRRQAAVVTLRKSVRPDTGRRAPEEHV